MLINMGLINSFTNPTLDEFQAQRFTGVSPVQHVKCDARRMPLLETALVASRDTFAPAGIEGLVQAACVVCQSVNFGVT